MSKRNIKRIQAYLMVFAMVISLFGYSRAVNAKPKLNKKSISITVGTKITLKVKGTDKKVKWSSNNKRVATVTSKGKVKARKVGKATITARVGKKKYKCKVYVIEKKKKTEQEKTSEEVKTSEQEKISEEVKTSEQEKTSEEVKSSEQPASSEEATNDNTDESTSTEAITEATTEATTEAITEANSPGQDTLNADAGEYSISLTHTGEVTYYEPTGEGAAKLDDFATGYYTAAMNTYDYMNNMAGAYVEITDKDGDKVNVLITDRLPEGAKGDIDLKPAAFLSIEPLVTGRMNITWKIIPFPTNDPIQYVFKDGSSEWWTAVQVRNHRYPIAKFEYYDSASNQYVELPREEYNYFTAANGLGGPGPYTFRVTDIYGHQVVDTGIMLTEPGIPINGNSNFPY